MPDRGSRRSWCGAGASSPRTSGWRQGLQRPHARRRGKCLAGRPLLTGRFARFRQFYRPGLLLSSVDFEKAGPVVTAGEAISGAPDGEFLVAGAHEGLARPLATPVIVDRVDIIEARREIPAKQCFTITCGKVPPTLSDPTLAILVADCDADAALAEVAKAKIGGCRRRHQRRHGCKPKAQQTRAQQGGAPVRDMVAHRRRRSMP